MKNLRIVIWNIESIKTKGYELVRTLGYSFNSFRNGICKEDILEILQKEKFQWCT